MLKTQETCLRHHTQAQGFFTASVVDGVTGVVKRRYPTQRNLILDAGLDYIGTKSWFGAMLYCAVGTGTTPTKVAVDGTASQSGTTITLSGSSYSFVSGDVGSYLKWSSGEEAKITAFTNSTTVTAAVSQTVSSGSLVGLFRCGQTALDTEVKRTGGANSTNTIWPSFVESDGKNSQGMFWDDSTGIITLRRTLDQTTETGTVVYTEMGMSWTASTPGNLFCRVVFDTPVTVNSGEKLRTQYNLQLAIPYASTAARPTEVTVAISGWPYTYSISGIVSTGSNFTVTTTDNHHFIIGSKVNISGTSVGTYNAEWTIASVTADTFTVTSALNPGASSGGTCFLNTKADVYQCWYPFQGIGTTTSLSAGSGWPSTNGLPNGYTWGPSSAGLWDNAFTNGPSQVDNNAGVVGMYITTSRRTPTASIGSTISMTAGTQATNSTAASYTNGNFYRDYSATFAAGAVTSNDIRSLFIAATNSISTGTGYGGLLFDFKEVQRKNSTAALTLTFRKSWGRTLA